MSNWKEQALQRRADLIEALAEAHVDAGVYGAGWLRVDALGNVARINPEDILIATKQDSEDD